MALDDIDSDQQHSLLERVPGLDRDVGVYGHHARRALTNSEAAILRHRH